MTTGIANADNQVEHAADLLEQGVTSEGQADPAAAQTPFPTSLVLTREQEDRMVEFAMQWVQRLETEQGRVPTPAGSSPVPDRSTFMGKRELFTMRYYAHVEDRPLREPDSIWAHSNVPATCSQRIAVQMIARANNFFFGTEPWYSANFVGSEDRHKAEKVDRHSKWKFGQTGLRRVLEEATEYAFIRGEAVVKTTYQTKDRIFTRKGKALFDGGTGDQVADAKGNPIFDTDKTQPETQPVIDPASGQPALDPNGQPMMQPTGFNVLSRDGKTRIPQVPIWQDGNWPMKQRLFEGPEARIVFYKDFLCPLTAPNVNDAEFICHLYDMPVMQIVQTFQRLDLANEGAKDTFDSLKKAVEAIRSLAGQNLNPKSHANQPRRDFQEQSNMSSRDNPSAEVIECYMQFDANEDGLPEDIMLALDRKNQFPLFYDYVNNVTPKGKRPFSVVRAKAVDGRWYGVGATEYFQPEQDFIDLLLNRKNYRMSKAGRITFWNPAATVEGAANPNLRLHDGKTYRLREGYTGEQALSYVELPEDKADLMDLIQFVMQMMLVKSGIMNGNDGQMSGMDSTDLATGIRNVEKSGQELFAAFLSSLEPGHQDVLQQQIEMLYAYLSEAELFRFFDKGTGAMSFDTLSPEEVAEMEFDVSILLTRVHTEQVIQTAQQVSALIVEFYTVIQPQVQPLVAQSYRDRLKALGDEDADHTIVAQPMLAMPGQPGQPGQQPLALPAGNGAPLPPQSVETKGIATPAAPTPAPEQSAPLL